MCIRDSYSPMCNENGGIIDDLLIYKFSDTLYMAVVNASNREKDAQWIREHLSGDVQFRDCSDEVAQVALQGPLAEKTLLKCTSDAPPTGYYKFVRQMDVAGVSCLVSRTGYTGEDGFELYCAAAQATVLWDALLHAGAEFGVIPCGLGARDTLRLEASMPLYGHEMNDEITPVEADLSFFVKMNKPNFIGKASIEAKGAPKRRRTGLRMTGRGIAREGCKVYHDGQEIGVVTSGTHCPYLGHAAAMALLSTEYTQPGTPVEIDVRGRRIPAETVTLPFYKRAK